MATKDVKLILSAEDKTKSALSDYKKSLQSIQDVNKKIATSGMNVKEALTSIGAALKGVQTAAGNSAGLDVFDDNLNIAKESAKKMADKVKSLSVELDKNKAKQIDLAKSVASTKESLTTATENVTKQSGALRKLTANNKKAKTAISKFGRQQETLRGQMSGTADKIEAVKTKIEKLNASITTAKSLGKPYKGLTTQLGAAETALGNLVTKQDKYSSSLNELAAEEGKAKAALKQTTKGHKTLSGQLKKSKIRVTDLSAQHGVLSTSLGKTDTAIGKLSTAMAREATEAKNAADSISKISDTTMEAQSVLNRTADSLKGVFRRAALEAKRDLRTTETAFSDLTKQIGITAEEMKKPGADIDNLSKKMAAQVDQARLLKESIQSQREGYNKLSAATREETTTLEGLANKQGRVQAAIAATTAKVNSLTAALDRAKAASNIRVNPTVAPVSPSAPSATPEVRQASTRSLLGAKQGLRASEQALADIQAEMHRTVKQSQTLGDKSGALAQKFEALRSVATNLKKDIINTRDTIHKAGQAFKTTGGDVGAFGKKLNSSTSGASVASKNLNTIVDRVEAVDQSFKTATKGLDKGFLLSSTKAKKSVKDTQAQLTKLTDQIGGLSKAMKKPNADTELLGSRMDHLKERAKLLKRELINQREGHHKLSKALRTEAVDMGSLADKHDKVNRAVAKTSATTRDFKDQIKAVKSRQLATTTGIHENRGRIRGEIAKTDLEPQIQNYNKLKKAVDEVTKARKKNAEAIKAQSKPSAKLLDDQAALSKIERNLRKQMSTQKAGYNNTKKALDSTATSTDQLAQKQKAVSQSVSDTTEKLKAQNEQLGKMSNKRTQTRDLGTSGLDDGKLGRLRDNMAQADAARRKAESAVSSSGTKFKKTSGSVRMLTRRLGALGAVYLSLHGAANGIRAVFHQTQLLESATSKMTVAFGEAGVSKNMDFVRRLSDKLGISFGDLASQYASFAVSTQNTKLEGFATQDVFKSVVSMSRAMHLTEADIKGVMKAVVQISNKEKFLLEELAGQLGERLPGAVKMMADSMNISTKELMKQTKEGLVGAEKLIGFADQMDKVSGDGLEKSLEGATAAVGRMNNAFDQALMSLGDQGFNAAMKEVSDTVTKFLRSAEGQATISTLAEAAKSIGSHIASVVKNMGAILNVARTILIPFRALYKVIGWIAEKLFGVSDVMETLRGSSEIVDKMEAFVFGAKPNNVLHDLKAQQETLDGIKNKYEEINKEIRKTEEQTGKKLTEPQRAGRYKAAFAGDASGIPKLEASLKRLKVTTDQLLASASNVTVQYKELDVAVGVNKLARQHKDGKISAKELKEQTNKLIDEEKKRLTGIRDTTPEIEKAKVATKAFEKAITAEVESLVKAEDGTKQAEAAIKLLSGEATKADGATLGLEQTAKELADTMAKKATVAARDNATALKELQTSAAGANKELKQLADLQSQIKAMGPLALTEEGRAAAAASYGRIKAKHFKASLKNVKNTDAENRDLVKAAGSVSQRTGLTREDIMTMISYETAGTFGKNKKGPITKWGQHKGLIQWGEPQRAAAGITDSTPIAVQVNKIGDYLLKNGFKKGMSVAQAYATINAGNPNRLGARDKGAGGAAGTVLQKVKYQFPAHRAKSAKFIKKYGGQVTKIQNKEIALEKKKAALVKKKQVKQTKFNDKIKADLKKAEIKDKFKGKLDKNKKSTLARDQELAIHKAKVEAQKKGLELSKEQEAVIKRRVALEKGTKNADIDTKTAMTEKIAAEKRYQALLERRKSLVNKRSRQVASGNTKGIKATNAKIAEMDAKMAKAAQTANGMWSNVAGSKGQAAQAQSNMSKVGSSTQQMGQTGTQATDTFGGMGEAIGGQLTSSIEGFVTAVANGEDASEAAEKAFKQFALSVIKQLLTMTLKQGLFNQGQGGAGGGIGGMLGGGGGGGGGGIGGIFGGGGGGLGSIFGFAHSGGMVGSNSVGNNPKRRMNPNVFKNARRMHTGGMVGLKNDEVPTILQKGEQVLSKNDPMNAANRTAKASEKTAAQPQVAPQIKVVNTIDAGDFVSKGSKTRAGETAIINAIKANKSSVKSALK